MLPKRWSNARVPIDVVQVCMHDVQPMEKGSFQRSPASARTTFRCLAAPCISWCADWQTLQYGNRHPNACRTRYNSVHAGIMASLKVTRLRRCGKLLRLIPKGKDAQPLRSTGSRGGKSHRAHAEGQADWSKEQLVDAVFPQSVALAAAGCSEGARDVLARTGCAGS